MSIFFQKRSSALLLAILLGILLPVASSAAHADDLEGSFRNRLCSGLRVAQILDRLRWSPSRLNRVLEKFDFQQYETALEKYQAHPDELRGDSPEEALAYLALQRNNGGIDSILNGEDQKRQAALIHLVQKQVSKGPNSEGKNRQFISKLYLLMRGPEPDLLDFASRNAEQRFESGLRVYLDRKITEQGWIQFAEKSGLLKPSSLKERFRNFVVKPTNQILVSGLFTLQLALGHASPVYLPDLHWIDVPPEWIAEASNQGLANVWPEAKSSWLKNYKSERAYQSTRSAMLKLSYLALSAYAIQSLTKKLKIAWMKREAAKHDEQMTKSVERLTKTEQQQLQEEEQPIGPKLLADYVAQWEKSHGRPIDKNSKEYRQAYRIFMGQASTPSTSSSQPH